MDNDARQSPHRWRELLEATDQEPHLQGHERGVCHAASSITFRFFEETATVFDYLGKMPRWLLHGDLQPAFQRFWQDAGPLPAGDAPDRPALPPSRCFKREQFYSRANDYPRWRCAARLKTLPTTRRFKAQ
jgi:transcription-repair coupling factor (superfamily II helicase)